MADIDDFATLLFDEAKAFLERAKTARSAEARNAHLHASLLVGFCSLEAHLNSIADDFLMRTDLNMLDRSILSEKEIELKNGEYQLTDRLKMFRLEDRIEHLSKTFSATPIDKTAAYWAPFKSAIDLRNNLTHPKKPPNIDIDSTERALTAILNVLNTLYQNIYRRPHPSYRLGTSGTMSL
jgi:hypothetical protein